MLCVIATVIIHMFTLFIKYFVIIYIVVRNKIQVYFKIFNI